MKFIRVKNWFENCFIISIVKHFLFSRSNQDKKFKNQFIVLSFGLGYGTRL